MHWGKYRFEADIDHCLTDMSWRFELDARLSWVQLLEIILTSDALLLHNCLKNGTASRTIAPQSSDRSHNLNIVQLVIQT